MITWDSPYSHEHLITKGVFLSIDASFLQCISVFTSQKLSNSTRNICHLRIEGTARVVPVHATFHGHVIVKSLIKQISDTKHATSH